jgi:hypothetical protein
MAQHHLLAGPGRMPPPRARDAPYFSEHVDCRISDFLKEYEDLADSNGLSRRQKVETVIRYVTSSHRNFWMLTEGYATGDWDAFCRALKRTYVDVSSRGKYNRDKLGDYTRQTCRYRMRDEEDILQYFRQFAILSKPLIEARALTESERDRAFWFGFHPQDRDILHTRLRATHTNHVEGTPFDYEDVFDAAKATFTGNTLAPVFAPDPWDSYDDSRSRDTGRRYRPDDRDPREFDRDPRESNHDRRDHEREREREPFEYRPRERRQAEDLYDFDHRPRESHA